MNNYPYDPNYEYTQVYKQAAQHVKAKIGFYWHLAVYLVINAFLFGIYLVNSLVLDWFGYPWFLWPLAAWGIGLIFHSLAVFVFPDSPARRQQMIARELGRLNLPAVPTYPYTYMQNPVQPGPIPKIANHQNEPEPKVPAGR